MPVRISGAVLALLLLSQAPAAAVEPDSAPERHLLDRLAIENLLTTYFYRLDHGQSDRLAELYTPDGVIFLGRQGEIKGHDAIAAHYAARSKAITTRHVMTNLYLEFDDADHVQGVHTFIYYMGQGKGPFPAAASLLADYEIRLARGKDGKWLIAYRKATPIFNSLPSAK